VEIIIEINPIGIRKVIIQHEQIGFDAGADFPGLPAIASEQALV
jgi:hypothetical protein